MKINSTNKMDFSKSTVSIVSIICLLILLVFSNDSKAQAGSLDSTFSNDGILIDEVGSYTISQAVDIALNADGKLVVVCHVWNGSTNDIAVTRYNSDGTLDTSFGDEGIKVFILSSILSIMTDIQIQTDGKIILAGFMDSGAGDALDMTIIRLNEDGSLDSSFSGDGIQTIDINGDADYVMAIKIQPDGKIVAAGYTGLFDSDFALMRLLPNGNLDPSFNGTGIVTYDFGSPFDRGYAVDLMPDGRIIIAGSMSNGQSEDLAVIRYNDNGTFDSTFSNDGILTLSFSSGNDNCFGVSVQPDGKMVFIGTAYLTFSTNQISAARLNTDGSLDNTFSDDGIQLIGSGNNMDWGSDLVIQPNGKILIAGMTAPQGYTDFSLVRLESNGSLDASFGIGGFVSTPLNTDGDSPSAMVLQNDGKVILVGQVSYESIDAVKLAAVRYLGNSESNVSIPNSNELKEPIIYPSPCQDQITIKLNETNNTNSIIYIYNALGQIVMQKKFSTDETILKFDLPNGFYTLIIINDEMKKKYSRNFEVIR